MLRPLDLLPPALPTRRTAARGILAAGLTVLLAGCSGISLPSFTSSPTPAPAGPPQPATALGTGQVKVGLILPVSAGGNVGTAAQSMRNAAELALAEFNAPNIQLLIKDDGGNPAGAQQAAQDAVNEGAELILGPLFAPTVPPVGSVARGRNIPVIAFSTDSTVASRGVHLLSFLPEADVDRVVDYAVTRGKRSFAALIPDGPYGNVVDAAFRQATARQNARVVSIERSAADRNAINEAVRRLAPAFGQIDTLFLPGDPDFVILAAQALAAGGGNLKRVQLLGTGLWDDPRIYQQEALHGGWFAAPETAGFRGFSARYRGKYGQDPVRTATLAYDAVSLAAALVKTQGPQRFSEQTLTNASGFSGIDGIFRFRPDGTNERGLSIVRVGASGAQSAAPAPKAFGGT